MRQVVYSPGARRLVYLQEKATPAFWDDRWRSAGKPPVVSAKDDVVTVTRRYLPPGSRVLEGGCGRANKVKAMADAGFEAVGVDFAEGTVEQATRDYPGLDIRKGDVRSLDLADGSLDGYWSIGVIEHFWDGYDSILAEAARVLRPGGYLFLTAPWFSPYRSYKARTHGYPATDFVAEPDSFYQFALGREEVSSRLAHHRFEILGWYGRASEISLQEDMRSFRRGIEWLFDSRSRGSIAKRAVNRLVTRMLDPYCGHSFLAIARRKAR
jgi:SAM-dependent methyltransferase